MNTYVIYFIRVNMIPANKEIKADSEKDALSTFLRDTIFYKILKIELK